MSFTFVCLVVGSAGSGKTTTIQRVQDATRNESTGRAFGLKSLQDELTADGESTHKEEALFLFRSSTRGERSEGEEDENDEEPLAEAEAEAEARVLLHEITSGDGGKGGSALALASEVRRTKSIARAALVLFDVTNLSSYTTAKVRPPVTQISFVRDGSRPVIDLGSVLLHHRSCARNCVGIVRVSRSA